MAAEAPPPGKPRLFHDTFALLELANGNPAYVPYAGLPVYTHQFNVYEFVAAGLRERHSEAAVREQVHAMNPNLLEATLDDLIRASHFRLEHASRRLSYVDALGYVLAKRHGLRFLTGDRQFQDLPRVEFAR